MQIFTILFVSSIEKPDCPFETVRRIEKMMSVAARIIPKALVNFVSIRRRNDFFIFLIRRDLFIVAFS